MKLTDVARDPSLKSSGNPGYKYSVKIKGEKKAKMVNGHMGAVFEIVEGILKNKLMTEQELLNIRASASYHLLMEVTDLADDGAIKDALASAGWSKRYNIKRKIEIEGEVSGKAVTRKYIVCREWVTKRIDKLIAGTSHVCKVERIEQPAN